MNATYEKVNAKKYHQKYPQLGSRIKNGPAINSRMMTVANVQLLKSGSVSFLGLQFDRLDCSSSLRSRKYVFIKSTGQEESNRKPPP